METLSHHLWFIHWRFDQNTVSRVNRGYEGKRWAKSMLFCTILCLGRWGWGHPRGRITVCLSRQLKAGFVKWGELDGFEWGFGMPWLKFLVLEGGQRSSKVTPTLQEQGGKREREQFCLFGGFSLGPSRAEHLITVWVLVIVCSVILKSLLC